MARTKTAPTKAAKEEKPAQPAVEPAKGVGIKEMADDLGKSQKSVRAAIRRINGGPVVGRGGRYSWDSKEDPKYKDLVKQLTASAPADE